MSQEKTLSYFNSNDDSITHVDDLSSDFNQTDCVENKNWDRLPFISDFSLLEKLSSEGTTCHAYRWKYLSRVYFVKRLKTEFVTSPQYVNAFIKEFELGSRLSHPSLPRYVDFRRTDSECYIVMEYIDGKNIRDYYHKHHLEFTSEFEDRIICQLIEVLEYLHRQQVVHYDLIPDNIMIKEGLGNVVLIDLDKCLHSSFEGSEGRVSRFHLEKGREKSADADFKALGWIVRNYLNHSEEKDKKERFCALCDKPGVTARSLLDLMDRKYSELDDMVPLKRNGYSCDAYRALWRGAPVFVKKLRNKFLNNQYMRDAMKDEFDRMYEWAPGIAEYLSFRNTNDECYIIIDYVEGETLGEMITARDSWLNDRRNIKSLMKNLLEPLEYLWEESFDYMRVNSDCIVLSPDRKYLSIACLGDVLNVKSVPSKYTGTSTVQTRDRNGTILHTHTFPSTSGVFREYPMACMIMDDLRSAGYDVSWLDRFYYMCSFGGGYKEIRDALAEA